MMVKRRTFTWRKTMIIHRDNMIAQKSTYNIIFNTNKWSHSSVGRNHTKPQNKTIKNGDSETVPLFWEKKMIIYSNNMTTQKITSNVISNPNNWSYSSVGSGKNIWENIIIKKRWWWNDSMVLGEKQCW